MSDGKGKNGKGGDVSEGKGKNKGKTDKNGLKGDELGSDGNPLKVRTFPSYLHLLLSFQH